MAKGRRVDHTGRSKGDGGFVLVPHYVMDSPAYRSLSLKAKAAFFEIVRVYYGRNNGSLVMSTRRLAERLGCVPNTACAALRELVEKGFLDDVKRGAYSGRENWASEFRLTFQPCNKTHSVPSKRFLSWNPETVSINAQPVSNIETRSPFIDTGRVKSGSSSSFIDTARRQMRDLAVQ